MAHRAGPRDSRSCCSSAPSSACSSPSTGARPGSSWRGTAPTFPWRDVVIQRRENDVVGATFGRGFYILDDYSPLRARSAQKQLREDKVLFPVRRARRGTCRGARSVAPRTTAPHSRVPAYFVAPNPDFGATFTYYLPQGPAESPGKVRRERRKAAGGRRCKDTPFPGWDEVQAEVAGRCPCYRAHGARCRPGSVVRHVEGPAGAGFHRVSWDLRYPAEESVGSAGAASTGLLGNAGGRSGGAGRVQCQLCRARRRRAARPRPAPGVRGVLHPPADPARQQPG